ncbi:MAG: thermonuclease family protein [Candidatus Pacebacteria bacterium]|nr:thermonuclease family protein [Candidatus Paceibacterota bacterium]
MQYIVALAVLVSIAIFGVADTNTSTPQHYDAVAAWVVRVADGDTIVVRINGREERVRYIGIDTPEHAREHHQEECYAHEATEANKRVVAGKHVTLIRDSEDRDTYDRLLRYVYVDDLFVNAYLVQEGYADTLFIPPNTQYASTFTSLKDAAQADARGMWGQCP